ncbi:TetR/AcrR family transcriptional regulator [Arvimicrobium flavum]|uniref:TetR/AcrR family transcriptional regulator n=1 Tax=Arvimicrobium flavum TaxID=3393320 RepID=UPI00237C4307|nr:TetR/AcrR family transcriptional regulator [Mesorhizobium shangrilense]
MSDKRKDPTPRTSTAKKAKPPVPRLRPAERRAQILTNATTYFAEHGLTAQTRAIAEACGVTQRLLYRYFPSKAALMSAVYDEQILAPFKAAWILQLRDRSISIEERIEKFYDDYFYSVLTRKWLRLFMHASLSDLGMAPNYINSIIKQLLVVIAEEVAAAQEVALPQSQARVLEIAWVLHGAVSHFAIRRHLYNADEPVADTEVLKLHVSGFLGGFAAACATARAVEAR